MIAKQDKMTYHETPTLTPPVHVTVYRELTPHLTQRRTRHAKSPDMLNSGLEEKVRQAESKIWEKKTKMVSFSGEAGYSGTNVGADGRTPTDEVGWVKLGGLRMWETGSGIRTVASKLCLRPRKPG